VRSVTFVEAVHSAALTNGQWIALRESDEMIIESRSLLNLAPLLLSLLTFVPNPVAAQGQDNRYNPTRITCSSNDGNRTFCDVDTRGGVRLVRQVGDSPCRQDSTWGYDERGVWVDQGCSGVFEVSSGNQANVLTQTSNLITCRSGNGQRVYCEADTTGGVRLTRQISDYPCQQGATWGFDTRGIWVDQGCGAEFDVRSGAASVQENYVDGRYATAGNAGSSIEAGTEILVRTNERINARNSDGRVYTGVIERDVMDASGRIAVQSGSTVELTVRGVTNQLVLDLESVTMNGQRFAVDASADEIGGRQRDGVGANNRTGEFVGGGALLGTILGAIAGGGRGAAIGALSGAGAGAGTLLLTRGRRVNLPEESLVTFRLNQAIQTGVADNGFNRNGHHYHVRAR
jgi:hypothetical protein